MKQLTGIERAQRIVNIMRTMPQEWTDSTNWRDSDLDAVAGLIECRFRVNVPAPTDLIFIVHTLRLSLSFECIEAANIHDAKSISLIAIRSMWGPNPEDVANAEHASRILESARSTEEWIVKVGPIFRHGKNERDDSPFVFSEWAPSTAIPEKQNLQLQKKVLPDYPGFNEAVNLLRAMPKTKGKQSQVCREVCGSDAKAAATLRTYLQANREQWHEDFR